MEEIRKWYQGADFLVRGRNAFNILLVSLLMTIVTPVAAIVAKNASNNNTVWETVIVLVLFLTIYVVIAIIREQLWRSNNGKTPASVPVV